MASCSSASSRNVGHEHAAAHGARACARRGRRAAAPRRRAWGSGAGARGRPSRCRCPARASSCVTSARSSPALSRSSSRKRRSRESEPWYGSAISSPASALTRAAIRSACARLLTKTSVVRAPRIWSSTSGATDVQIVPSTCARSSTGDTTRVSIRFTSPQSTMVDGPEARFRRCRRVCHNRRGTARSRRAAAASPTARCAAARRARRGSGARA